MQRAWQVLAGGVVLALLLAGPRAGLAQEQGDEAASEDAPQVVAALEETRRALTNKTLTFDLSASTIPDEGAVREVLWDFGDGVRTTGERVSHSYARAGTYLVRLRIETEEAVSEDTMEVRIFDRVMVLLSDGSASDEQLALRQEQAAAEGLLLVVLRAKSGGPEALVEEELTQALLGTQTEVARAPLVVAWTSGGVGANVLSRFGQQVGPGDELPASDLALGSKGIILLSETPFGVLSPVAQSTFDQLGPSYVLLTRPDALPLLFTPSTADEAREVILASPIEYRLLGTFSSRAVADLGVTNFISFGVSYLVNHGVPINNILLILMIPVIATILAFARHIIGIRAFGLITPAMTTLAFLVTGLQAGLLIFIVVLLSGTLTRIGLRRLRLQYLPRMGLVLTSASLAILVLLGVSVATGQTARLSFSIFPILILIILAEEFIAVQFTRGAQVALKTTLWTLLLVIVTYSIVSWELLRTLLLAYPEVVLLAIPCNIILGRFSGLRLMEYVRFRELLRSPRGN